MSDAVRKAKKMKFAPHFDWVIRSLPEPQFFAQGKLIPAKVLDGFCQPARGGWRECQEGAN